MNKREIEQILYDLHKDKSNDKVINLVIKSYNLGLQDAVDNVELKLYCDIPETEYIDVESILKLKL